MTIKNGRILSSYDDKAKAFDTYFMLSKMHPFLKITHLDHPPAHLSAELKLNRYRFSFSLPGTCSIFDEAKNRHFWPRTRGRDRKNRTVLVSTASATRPKRADFGLVKKSTA